MTKNEFLKRYDESVGIDLALHTLRQTQHLHLQPLQDFLLDFCWEHLELFPLFDDFPSDEFMIRDIAVFPSGILQFSAARIILDEPLQWQTYRCPLDTLFERSDGK